MPKVLGGPTSKRRNFRRFGLDSVRGWRTATPNTGNCPFGLNGKHIRKRASPPKKTRPSAVSTKVFQKTEEARPISRFPACTRSKMAMGRELPLEAFQKFPPSIVGSFTPHVLYPFDPQSINQSRRGPRPKTVSQFPLLAGKWKLDSHGRA